MSIPIPLIIGESEVLIRGILHPMFYSNSKKKLKREAFVPAPEKRDVSLLRHSFATDDSFCKAHCKSLRLGDNKYCGIATFLAIHVQEINTQVGEDDIAWHVKASPINEHGQYFPEEEINVFNDTPGLPMHADLIYNIPVQKGEPATKHRILANQLLKIVNYYHDEHPDEDGWSGAPLAWQAAS